MPPETPKFEIAGENAPERRVFENIVFDSEVMQTGETRYRNSAPGRKLIVLDSSTTIVPKRDRSYTVEVIRDTNPSDPQKGIYFVHLQEDPEFSDVPMVSEQAYQERQLPLPLEVDEGAGSVYVLETQLPLNPVGGESAVSEHVPDLKKFEYFTLEKRTLEVIEKIALAVSLSEPCLLEGETSTSKTSCIEYLAALTRMPVLRMNLNGQTDTSELIGKFVPHDGRLQINFENALRHPEILTETSKSILERANKEGRPLTLIESQKIGAEQGIKAPDWRWQDGLVPEAMKKGYWLILDEINLAEPQVLERINPVLERHPSLTISENGGLKIGGKSAVPVHPGFRIFATMNPAEYSGRQPMSPAYKDRWTAYKYVEIPSAQDYEDMLNFMVYGVQPAVTSHDKQYRREQKKGLHERLAAIPNFNKFLPLLASFHKKLEVLMQTSQIGKGRKEKYIITRRTLIEFLGYLEQIRLTDRATKKQMGIEEMPKEIILRALEYYYTDKVRAVKEGGDLHDDFKKLNDLLDAVGISRAQWKVPEFTKPPEPRPAATSRPTGALRGASSGPQSPEPLKPRIFKSYGGLELHATIERARDGFTIGDQLRLKSGEMLALQLQGAKKIEVVGFIASGDVIIQFDDDRCSLDSTRQARNIFEIIPPPALEPLTPRTFMGYTGSPIEATPVRSFGRYTIGDKLKFEPGTLNSALGEARVFKVVGFNRYDEVIVQMDGDKCFTISVSTINRISEVISSALATPEPIIPSYELLNGFQVIPSFLKEIQGKEKFKISDRLKLQLGITSPPELFKGSNFEIVAIDAMGRVIVQIDGGKCWSGSIDSLEGTFEKSASTPQSPQGKKFEYVFGGMIGVSAVLESEGYRAGDELKYKRGSIQVGAQVRLFEDAKKLTLVGFSTNTKGEMLAIIQADGAKCGSLLVSSLGVVFEKVKSTPSFELPKIFPSIEGGILQASSEQRVGNFQVGDIVRIKPGINLTNSRIMSAKQLEIVGFDSTGVTQKFPIIRIDGNKCFVGTPEKYELLSRVE